MERRPKQLVPRIHDWTWSIFAQRVHRQFRRRQSEYEPAAPIVDKTKSKNVAKEYAICFWVSAVKNNMSAVNHVYAP
jgi:hypothetical protein